MNKGELNGKPQDTHRRDLGQTALAGATLIGEPLPLRYAAARTTGNLKTALLLPTSGIKAQIGQAWPPRRRRATPSSAACRVVVNTAAAPQITETHYKPSSATSRRLMLIAGALALHK